MATHPDTLTHASGRPLHIAANRALLAFEPAGRPAGFDKTLASVGLVREDATGDSRRQGRVNQTPRFCFVRSKDGEPIEPKALDKLMALLGQKGKKPRLIWTGPVYRFVGDPSDRGLIGVLRDTLVLTPLPGFDAKAERALAARLKRLGLAPHAKRSKQIAPSSYLVASDLADKDAIRASAALVEVAQGGFVAHPGYIPMMSPACATPSSETHWASQWNMLQIGAEAAWDVTKGVPGVCVCVVDQGIQRIHEELNRASSYGYEAAGGTSHAGFVAAALDDVSANANDAHGTAIASISSGAWDTGGVAGLAGDASVFALAVPNWIDTEVLAAVNRAKDGTTLSTATVPLDRRVLLLPFVHDTFKTPAVQAAIEDALNQGLVVVCASGDETDTNSYPADGSHPRAIVCGASDQADARYQSKFPAGLSVVAPGKDIPAAAPSGAYVLAFAGSSCGAAHVAGTAALVLSNAAASFTSYPFGASRAAKVRSVIERTAQKVGGVYSTEINPRNPELGFGRIRADWAVDFADVMIRDDPTDTGVEPSTGVFWRDSAVVIRRINELQATVETSFDTWHANPPDSTTIYSNADGSSCYAYVRVSNLGPVTARNVRVRAVGAACATGFMYPTDWNAPDDLTHFVMTPLPWPGDPAAVGDQYVVGNLAAGQSKIVRFEIAKAKADKGLAWPGSHVCGLAKVSADNDYAFALFNPASPVGGEQARRNNLCQRNLHVVTAASPWFFPFLAGNAADLDDVFEIVVEARRLPSGTLMRLGLDEPERAAPNLDLAALNRAAAAAAVPRAAGGHTSLTLLDRARVAVNCGGPAGVVTLPPGTRFECAAGERGDTQVTGGNLVLEGGKRVVETRGPRARVRMPKTPGAVMPLYLEIPVPPGTDDNERFSVDVIQKNAAGEVVGGVSLYLVP